MFSASSKPHITLLERKIFVSVVQTSSNFRIEERLSLSFNPHLIFVSLVQPSSNLFKRATYLSPSSNPHLICFPSFNPHLTCLERKMFVSPVQPSSNLFSEKIFVSLVQPSSNFVREKHLFLSRSTRV